MREDAKLILKEDIRDTFGQALHLPAAGNVIFGVLTLVIMPIWTVFLASYFAMALLKVLTFLEQPANEKARERTVMNERRGFGPFCF